MKIADDNDRLQAGALPSSPFDGTVKVSPGDVVVPAKPAPRPVVDEPLSLGVADFFASCSDKVEYLLEPFIIRRGFVLLIGAPKSGKTWFACWLAAAVASQPDQRVYVVEEEGSREILRDRLRPFLGPDVSVFNDRLRVLFRKGVRLDQSQWVDRLATECHSASLIVLDPFVGLHSRDENDQAQLGVVLAGLQQLISRTGASLVLIHHTRKGGSWDKDSPAPASSADARGSGAVVGAVDSVISIKAVANHERRDGEVRFYVENLDTRVGAPFPKRLAAINLTSGIGSLEWIDEDAGAAEAKDDLLERILAVLPLNPEEARSRETLRTALHVNMLKLRKAIGDGIQRGLITEVIGRGVHKTAPPPTTPSNAPSEATAAVAQSAMAPAQADTA